MLKVDAKRDKCTVVGGHPCVHGKIETTFVFLVCELPLSCHIIGRQVITLNILATCVHVLTKTCLASHETVLGNGK